MADDVISIEGIQDVLRNLDGIRIGINRAASYGLRAAGMNIIADAQVNLHRNGSWVTGLLANSGRVIYGGQDYDVGNLNDARQAKDSATALMSAGASGMDMGLDVGFFNSDDKESGYAAYVEYGRKAGKMPPIAEMAQWAHKKFQLPFRPKTDKTDKTDKTVKPTPKVKPAKHLKPRKPAAPGSSSKAEYADTVGFLVARKIAKQGSTPHPFFMPAVEKNKPAIINAIAEAVQKVIR